MKDYHPLARKNTDSLKSEQRYIRSLFVSDKFDFTINRNKFKISITLNVIGISTCERVRIGHWPILTLSHVEIPIMLEVIEILDINRLIVKSNLSETNSERICVLILENQIFFLF